MKASIHCTRRQYVCANERMKLIGSVDGYFPDFGHHLSNEMGGLWLHPIKLLDGFWLRFADHTSKAADCWIQADQFINYPHKNEFIYGNGLGRTNVKIRRTQLIPDDVIGLIVTYEFYNAGQQACECTTEFVARTDLRPVWKSEDVGIFDGEADEIIRSDGTAARSGMGKSRGPAFVAKDCGHPWHVAVGCDAIADEARHGQFFGPENTAGNGVSMGLLHHFTLKPSEHRTMKFYMTGSDVSEEEAIREYGRLNQDKDFEAAKEERFERLYKISGLHTGDKHFDEIFNWIKVHTDWLITAVSDGSRGIAAGIPEYPWWFGCDSFYALQGVLCMGDYKLCRDTLKLILYYSVKYNGNGRIVHEILTSGACPNYGNTQETAHFIIMVWKYYEWTGDFSLVEEAFEYVCKSKEWLEAQDDDHDFFPTGYGIIEIAGLNMEMIDVAAYACEAYACYGKMCKRMAKECKTGDEGRKDKLEIMAADSAVLAAKTKEAINTLLWNKKNGVYCDAYTSYEALNSKKDMIRQMLESAKSPYAKSDVERDFEERKGDGAMERGWTLNRNWVISVPLEIGIATKAQAVIALENMRSPEYIGPCGMYLDALSREESMTISTGVMAVAQARYGYADRALGLIERMFSTFGQATPGSISEMSPDYGCFVQAWTAYGVMLPVVGYFFGICPSASQDKIYLKPCLPSKWKKASIEHVKVFGGDISMYWERQAAGMTMRVCNTTRKSIELVHEGSFLIDGEPFCCKAVSDKREFLLTFE